MTKRTKTLSPELQAHKTMKAALEAQAEKALENLLAIARPVAAAGGELDDYSISWISILGGAYRAADRLNDAETHARLVAAENEFTLASQWVQGLRKPAKGDVAIVVKGYKAWNQTTRQDVKLEAGVVGVVVAVKDGSWGPRAGILTAAGDVLWLALGNLECALGQDVELIRELVTVTAPHNREEYRKQLSLTVRGSARITSNPTGRLAA